jgi:hypothetical protein
MNLLQHFLADDEVSKAHFFDYINLYRDIK